MVGQESNIEHAIVVHWLRLIRAEYLEAPGLRVTLAEARRFWGLDVRIISRVFEILVNVGFLKQTRKGVYLRTGAS
jgi:hypothetical protein